ncbi:hypothetical protein TKK_0013965 [Trichogramma kaykai]|uniref:Helicase C-terminal domain-containing protein n=1 Tax=Trichogramma kaykai TaxID=54128 RepID=A0ABD2WG32_9HYME
MSNKYNPYCSNNFENVTVEPSAKEKAPDSTVQNTEIVEQLQEIMSDHLASNNECSQDSSNEVNEKEKKSKTENTNSRIEEIKAEGSPNDMDLDETIDSQIRLRMEAPREQLHPLELRGTGENEEDDIEINPVNILDSLPLEGAPIEGQEVSEADLLGKIDGDDDEEDEKSMVDVDEENILEVGKHHVEHEENKTKGRKKQKKEKDDNNENNDLESKADKKQANMRKNIREVMDETQLDESTLAAQRQEMERLRRVQEQQRIIREVRLPSSVQLKINPPSGQAVSISQSGTSQHHKSSKQGSKTSRSPTCSSANQLQQRIRMMTPSVSILPVVSKKDDIEEEVEHLEYYTDSELSDGAEADEVISREIKTSQSDVPLDTGASKVPGKQKGKDVVTISSSSENSDDDCIVLSDEEEEEVDDEDPSNSGMHTNDRYNVPDEQGRVLVNVGHPENEPDVFLAPQVAKIIKPHQIGGIRFLYDNIVESIDRFKSSSGFGCILAHSMGLGKTLQVATFCDIFFRCTDAKTVLCIMPINTLQNWLAEFNMWLPYEDPNAPKVDKKEVVKEENQENEKSDQSESTMNSNLHQQLPPESKTIGSNSYGSQPGFNPGIAPPYGAPIYDSRFGTNYTGAMPSYNPIKHEYNSHYSDAYNIPPYSHYPPSNVHPPTNYVGMDSSAPHNMNSTYSNYGTNSGITQPNYNNEQSKEIPLPAQDSGKYSMQISAGQKTEFSQNDKSQLESKELDDRSDESAKEKTASESKNGEKVKTQFSVDVPEGLEVRPRHFHLHILNDSHKTMAARARVIREWQKIGGVLLIGYELYRQLSLKKANKAKRKRGQPIRDPSLDAEEDDKNKPLLDEMHSALVSPGPDLVICDEGHRIKNSHASISLALKQMRTKRRIVLTGYPLQNNLLEYWCMVDFVRPNYLGSKSEFCNMFERPIQNGQCIDSTPQDIRLMRYRAHVLHDLLAGFVQRRSHTVLQQSLPRKEEYILLVRMTPHQRKLYDTFMNQVVKTRAVPNPLKAFAVCCKIWNHPDVLYHFLKKRQEKEEDDLDLEETISDKTSTVGVKRAAKPRAPKGEGKRGRKAKPKPAASVLPSSINENSKSPDKPKSFQNMGPPSQAETSNSTGFNAQTSYQQQQQPQSTYQNYQNNEYNYYNNQNQQHQKYPMPGSNQAYPQNANYSQNDQSQQHTQEPYSNQEPYSEQQQQKQPQQYPGQQIQQQYQLLQQSQQQYSGQQSQPHQQQQQYSGQHSQSNQHQQQYTEPQQQYSTQPPQTPYSGHQSQQQQQYSNQYGLSTTGPDPSAKPIAGASSTISGTNYSYSDGQMPVQQTSYPQNQLNYNTYSQTNQQNTNYSNTGTDSNQSGINNYSNNSQNASSTQNARYPNNQPSSINSSNYQQTMPNNNIQPHSSYSTQNNSSVSGVQNQGYCPENQSNAPPATSSSAIGYTNHQQQHIPAQHSYQNQYDSISRNSVQNYGSQTSGNQPQISSYTNNQSQSQVPHQQQQQQTQQTSYQQPPQVTPQNQQQQPTYQQQVYNTQNSIYSHTQPQTYPTSQGGPSYQQNQPPDSTQNQQINYSQGSHVKTETQQQDTYPSQNYLPPNTQLPSNNQAQFDSQSQQQPPPPEQQSSTPGQNQYWQQNYQNTNQSYYQNQNSQNNYQNNGTSNYPMNQQLPTTSSQVSQSNQYQNYSDNSTIDTKPAQLNQSIPSSAPSNGVNSTRMTANSGSLQQQPNLKPSIDSQSSAEQVLTETSNKDEKTTADLKDKDMKNTDKEKADEDDETASRDEEKEKIGSSLMNSLKDGDPGIPYDWAYELMKNYVPGLIEASAKMKIFFVILEEAIRLGDRVLTFSQSLFTLNLIEDFLANNDFENVEGQKESWARNVNYFRLDGSTSALEREKLINEFNANKKVHLFLVSTRAGSLGINLVGANRAIVFDASWNPCHDTQAVCRVYRYGQQKSCFVYRLVTDNCLERKIYDRQISKQGMSDRVVDQCNPDAHLSLKEATTLSWEWEEDSEVQDFSDLKDKYHDSVVGLILEKFSALLTKEPFNHESLLIDRKDKKLSQAEKRLARRGYELEKMAANTAKPSYNYIPGNTAPRVTVPASSLQIRQIRDAANPIGKPVASVRPMQQRGSDGLSTRNSSGSKWIPAEVWQRQGMSAQEMTLPLDVVIPTNSPDKGSIVLKAGQRVMVLKSPKGIYMQLESGKIIAIRTALKMNQQKKDDEPVGAKKGVVTEGNRNTSNKEEIGFPLRNNSAISIIPKNTSNNQPQQAPTRPLLMRTGVNYRPYGEKEVYKRTKATTAAKSYVNPVQTNQISLSRINKPKHLDNVSETGSIGENSNSCDSQKMRPRVEEIHLDDMHDTGSNSMDYSPSSSRRSNSDTDSNIQRPIMEGRPMMQGRPVANFNLGRPPSAMRHVQDMEQKKFDPYHRPLSQSHPRNKHTNSKDDIHMDDSSRHLLPRQSSLHQTNPHHQSHLAPSQRNLPRQMIQRGTGNSPRVTSDVRIVKPHENVNSSISQTSLTSPSATTTMPVRAKAAESDMALPTPPQTPAHPAYPYAPYPRYFDYGARPPINDPYGYSAYSAPASKAVDEVANPGAEPPHYPRVSSALPQKKVTSNKNNTATGVDNKSLSKSKTAAKEEQPTPTAFSHPSSVRSAYPPAPYPPPSYDPYSQHYSSAPAPGSSTSYPPPAPVGYPGYGSPAYNVYSAFSPPPAPDPYRGYAPPPPASAPGHPTNYYSPFPASPVYPNYSFLPTYSNPGVPTEPQPPAQ